jgi:transposase
MGDSPTSAVPGCANCVRLEREVHALREELADLRRQINRNSGNSSIPSSVNPPWAPRPGAKKPTGRKPGGQPGHQGHFRQMLPVAEVDEIIEHRPERCGLCGGELESSGKLLDRHQVSELPVRAVKITEHQALACRCKQCGLIAEGAIPPAVRRLVSGERLSALICYTSARMHGSRRAALEFLEDALGAPLGLGTIVAREKELTAALSQPYRQAKELIQKAPAKNVDETGWKRAAEYLWVAANRTLAVFHLDPCRNRDAMKQLLGEEVKGTICTDRYGVYEKVPLGQRALCWAHLMRDFTELSEQAGSARLGKAAVKLCKAVHKLWDCFEAETIDRPTLQKQAGKLRLRMRKLLKQGAKSPMKRARSFCKKLLRLEPAMWTFAVVEGIEPTNNHAERMLRPAVMWRKQSLGSHSIEGCRFVERTLTALQTLRLTGRSAMDFFTQAIHAFRHGLSPPTLIAA